MTPADLFCGAILLPAIGVMASFLTRTKSAEKKATDQISTAGTHSPTPSLDSEVETIRIQHQVTLVDPKDEGRRVESLLPGTYGFTGAPTNASPVFQKRISQGFEVHRLPDGAIHIIGFVTEQEATHMFEGRELLDLDLYPEPWEEAFKCVSVSRSRITRSKGPSRTNGNAIRIDLSAENEILQQQRR